jgi:hypothetical protein
MSLAVACFSPKGWDVRAQGNALGESQVDGELLLRSFFVQALKGRHARLPRPIVGRDSRSPQPRRAV